jgi:pimeloyl-ACP methyl ester carboxylesterase
VIRGKWIRFMEEVSIASKHLQLPGLLGQTQDNRGLVIFAHGSGSSRLSARNQYVAGRLNKKGFTTLLFDLLTINESQQREHVFDIDLLAERLMLATRWVQDQPALQDSAIGYFGASTGAAAALVAAAELGDEIAAMVSRGGRPDLAMASLAKVTAPTLLLVGELDHDVIELNKKAAARLARSETIIIPGATHLFEEPGTLDQVCVYANSWFTRFLAPQSGS